MFLLMDNVQVVGNSNTEFFLSFSSILLCAALRLIYMFPSPDELDGNAAYFRIRTQIRFTLNGTVFFAHPYYGTIIDVCRYVLLGNVLPKTTQAAVTRGEVVLFDALSSIGVYESVCVCVCVLFSACLDSRSYTVFPCY